MSVDPAVDHALRRITELEERVTRLEAERGGPATGFDPPPADPLEPSAYVRELLAAGKKIDAIHAYREQTGAGIKEAKKRVEALES